MAQAAVYNMFLHEGISVDQIARARGITPDSVRQYVSKMYRPGDAELIRKRLGVSEQTIVSFAEIMRRIQIYRNTHPENLKSQEHAELLSDALQGKCADIDLAKKLLGRIFNDLLA